MNKFVGSGEAVLQTVIPNICTPTVYGQLVRVQHHLRVRPHHDRCVIMVMVIVMVVMVGG